MRLNCHAGYPGRLGVSAELFRGVGSGSAKQAQSIVERAVEKLRTKLGSDNFELRVNFCPGPPRAVILDRAESWGADLIVVGSHGYGRWERFLLGSVSQSVVSHAKCSVEVVRCSTCKF